MKVAVLGAGFSGLALSWYLLQKGCEVTLYDAKGIGAGASGIASGLLHPYPGEGVKRSLYADEAMKETLALLHLAQKFSIDQVADFSGLMRHATPDQSETLKKHITTYGDVDLISNDLFLIKSGVSVYSTVYLDGLYKACLSKGLTFCVKKITQINELVEYSHRFFALGAGIFAFPDMQIRKVNPVKGQALICEWPLYLPPLDKAVLGKGHIVPLGKGLVHLGSTYERGLLDEGTSLENTLQALAPLAKELVPAWNEINPIAVRSGIRLAPIGHYLPFFNKVGSQDWVLTGMGSRGLLYHAYIAKQLVEAAFFNS